jgi:hypothetical protein
MYVKGARCKMQDDRDRAAISKVSLEGYAFGNSSIYTCITAWLKIYSHASIYAGCAEGKRKL